MKKHGVTIATIVLLLAFLGASVWWAVYTWTGAEGGQISGHGWTAIVLTVVFSLVVGFGLMGLLFYSRRQGYDEPPEIDLRSPRRSMSRGLGDGQTTARATAARRLSMPVFFSAEVAISSG